MSTLVLADGNYDQCVGAALTSHESRSARVAVGAKSAVQPEIGVGQVWGIKHDVGRKGHDATRSVRSQVLVRQHLIDTRPYRRLEDSPGEGVGHEAPNFFRAFPLGAQFGDL